MQQAGNRGVRPAQAVTRLRQRAALQVVEHDGLALGLRQLVITSA